MMSHFSILYVLLCLTNASYGPLHLTDDKKSLYEIQGPVKHTLFKRTDTQTDTWTCILDKNVYTHKGGGYFSHDSKNYGVTTTSFVGKILKVLTDETSEKQVAVAVKLKDLINYNLYLFLGNTHNYETEPYIYNEKQEIMTCWMTCQNNLLQTEYWAKKNMNKELSRQYNLLSDQEKQTLQKDPHYKIGKFGELREGSSGNMPKINEALKHEFGLKSVDIYHKQAKTRGSWKDWEGVAMLTKEEFDPQKEYLVSNKVIGYIVYLNLMRSKEDKNHGKQGTHFLTIKYFGNRGWYNLDGAGFGNDFKLQPRGSFVECFKPSYDGWVKTYKIIGLSIYEYSQQEEHNNAREQYSSELSVIGHGYDDDGRDLNEYSYGNTYGEMNINYGVKMLEFTIFGIVCVGICCLMTMVSYCGGILTMIGIYMFKGKVYKTNDSGSCDVERSIVVVDSV
eukprot:432983_1